MSRHKKNKNRPQQAPPSPLGRRKILFFGAAALAALGIGYGLTRPSATRGPTYQDAFHNRAIQQQWLDGLASKEYATKHIATPAVLEQLRKTKGYAPPDGAFAATFPRDYDHFGTGAASDIYVFPECFIDIYAPKLDQMAVIIENVVNNHELLHAQHYFQGIPGYPLSLFDEAGKTNTNLFSVVSEVLAHKSERAGLTPQLDEGDMIRHYHRAIKDMVQPYVALMHGLTTNKTLIDKVNAELWF